MGEYDISSPRITDSPTIHILVGRSGKNGFLIPLVIMTNVENYQLLHPDLLTEDTLFEVLKERCIEVPVTKSNDKTELIEIFKRVAMPLPQRRYNDSTYLGRKLISLRKSRGLCEAAPSGTNRTSSDVEMSLKRNGSSPTHDGCVLNRLKPSLVDKEMESKKIKLSRSQTAQKTTCDTEKRKGNQNLTESLGCTKRQKITWP